MPIRSSAALASVATRDQRSVASNARHSPMANGQTTLKWENVSKSKLWGQSWPGDFKHAKNFRDAQAGLYRSCRAKPRIWDWAGRENCQDRLGGAGSAVHDLYTQFGNWAALRNLGYSCSLGWILLRVRRSRLRTNSVRLGTKAPASQPPHAPFSAPFHWRAPPGLYLSTA